MEEWAQEIIQGNPSEDLDKALELAAEFDVAVEIVLTNGLKEASRLQVTIIHPHRDTSFTLKSAVDTAQIANFITTTLWSWDRRDYV